MNENSESTFMFAAHTKVVVVVRRVQKRKVSLLFYGSKYDAMLWRTLTHSAVNSEKKKNWGYCADNSVSDAKFNGVILIFFLKFWFIFIFGAMCVPVGKTARS